MAKIIAKIIDILYLVFLIPKAQRENFYDKSVYDIKEHHFRSKLIELQALESFDIPFTNGKFKALFELISSALDAKKEYSFSDYIESVFFNLSFFKELGLLLKYQLFSIITRYYLHPIKIALDFNENEINISDDISLDLIFELFKNQQNNFETIIKSIIILNYGSLIKSIKEYTFEEILNGIKLMNQKVKKIENIGNIENISLLVEKIMLMLIDELIRQRNQKKKKKKKKSKKKNFNENNQKTDEKNLGESSSKTENNMIIFKEEIIDLKKDKPVNEIIETKDDLNDDNGAKVDKDIINQFEDLNKNFNNLLNYLNTNNLGKENIKNDVQNLQKIMLNIVDDNNIMKGMLEKMKQDILKLKEENKMQKQQIQTQKQDISRLEGKNQIQENDLKDLKESVEFLKNECKDLKESLSYIHCRDLSKNFLRVFGTFLTEDDWHFIRKDKNKRGKIISERIKILYPNADKKKFNLIKNLIEISSDLLLQRKDLPFSVTLEEYHDEIQAYKDEKNIKVLNWPVVFCFLISLGISDDLFDNAYLFLSKFFNRDLKAYNGKKLLDLYFN